MTPTRTRLLAATAAMILSLPLFVVAAGRADADTKGGATSARLLEIVITESPPTAAKDQTPHVVRIALSVAVATDGGAPPAQVWTRSGTSTYRVQVSPLGRGATAQIEIERTDRSANNSGAGDLKLAASMQLAAGKTVLARVDAHDGSRTEVMVAAP